LTISFDKNGRLSILYESPKFISNYKKAQSNIIKDPTPRPIALPPFMSSFLLARQHFPDYTQSPEHSCDELSQDAMGDKLRGVEESKRVNFRELEESIVDKLRGLDESMTRMQLLLETPLKTVESSKTELSALNSETNIKTNTSPNKPTSSMLNNSIIIATSTGSSSFMLPSDQANLDTASDSNINIDNNDKDNNENDNTESFVYEEEESCSNSDDDSLTPKVYFLADSISSSPYSGIYLVPVVFKSLSSLSFSSNSKDSFDYCKFFNDYYPKDYIF